MQDGWWVQVTDGGSRQVIASNLSMPMMLTCDVIFDLKEEEEVDTREVRAVEYSKGKEVNKGD